MKGEGVLLNPSGVVKILKNVFSGENFQSSKIMQKSKLNLKLRNMALGPLPQTLYDGIPCNFNNELWLHKIVIPTNSQKK